VAAAVTAAAARVYRRRDLARLLEAADFAARKHATQRRKDPEATPYINHPLGVAATLAVAGVGDVDVLMAALLHDTVEDTDCSLGEIDGEFGSVVASLVREVTDDKSLSGPERKRLQVLHTRDASWGARCVKLSDKLYNLRDLLRVAPVGWDRDRVRAYFRWSAQVVEGCGDACPEISGMLADVFDEFARSVGELDKQDRIVSGGARADCIGEYRELGGVDIDQPTGRQFL
jgi:guanosine-3',5'-bis(diphosphate) 3'-pyrophosphohydrolase